jgi:hypothetical protein
MLKAAISAWFNLGLKLIKYHREIISISKIINVGYQSGEISGINGEASK